MCKEQRKTSGRTRTDRFQQSLPRLKRGNMFKLPEYLHIIEPINCDDRFDDLFDWKSADRSVDDWQEADRFVVKGISFCTFLYNAVMLADFQAHGG